MQVYIHPTSLLKYSYINTLTKRQKKKQICLKSYLLASVSVSLFFHIKLHLRSKIIWYLFDFYTEDGKIQGRLFYKYYTCTFFFNVIGTSLSCLLYTYDAYIVWIGLRHVLQILPCSQEKSSSWTLMYMIPRKTILLNKSANCDIR